ncbi:arginyl-tRNA synthetase [Grosmannia clavigera kw1407]|uniref:arginine--tRNA ligase n=1 Tax=Grosmannia clavigera (strain kw1407 / UAMH 11150) TaxID=655863 RepID=F0X880_GROCL|nr:arginyl-tRNA synthetase [Grosmannia clavigera kw1407]EFX05657.1 arginyl-tRNA synthetase [Grosmannia clavigera kw1407]
MEEVMTTLKEKDIAQESDGHMVIDFTKHSGVKKGLGSVVVRYRNGSSTYLLRDVAAAIDRERAFAFDKMIYVVCSRQELHLAQVFSTLDLMGRSDLREKLQHVGFDRIQHLSERLGGVRTLDAIIDGTSKLMREAIAAELLAEKASGDGDGENVGEEALEVAHIGDTAAISAILDQDMSHRRSTRSTFDPKRMISLAGYTGLQLQECHAMLQLNIAELQKQVQAEEDASIDYSVLEQEDAAELLRMMAQYPEMTSSVFKSLEPSIVLAYLHRLADAIKTCLDSEEGLDEDEEGSEDEGGEDSDFGNKTPTVGQLKANLSMYENARQVLENGLRLLNIPIVA